MSPDERPDKWTVMFVDMVDSTRMKYLHGADTVTGLVQALMKLISDKATPRESLKFTGDGAMIVFRGTKVGASGALEAASEIVLGVDTRNLEFQGPRVRVRIGIATGEANLVGGVSVIDLVGTNVDLAARLCSEAQTDEVLVDADTRRLSSLPAKHFSVCERRLGLKGVPPRKEEVFYSYRIERLVRPPEDAFHSGLIGLYPDRDSLLKDLHPARFLHLARRGSTLLVAGRTLKAWTGMFHELLDAARTKDLHFRFLLSSEAACRNLEESQILEIRKDLPIAQSRFRDLLLADRARFEVRESSQLVIDGITCADIATGHDTFRLAALQDVNAVAGKQKSSLLWVCTCGQVPHRTSCMAGGLHKRTQILFANATPLTVDASPPGTEARVLDVLRMHGEGSEARHNYVRDYLARLPAHFRAAHDPRLADPPAPQCVQLQVASTCTTDCRMCDHWRALAPDNPLRKEDWIALIDELGSIGTQALIFSGGEPLTNSDLPELLEAAHRAGLRCGLLTSGTIPEHNNHAAFISTIRDRISWMAVSIDGVGDIDRSIRPIHGQSRGTVRIDRLQGIEEFVKSVRVETMQVSATVTLQRDNADMDFASLCESIAKIGIPRVNFKLATGSRDALNTGAQYLLAANHLVDLQATLRSDPIVQKDGNSLSYLRRSFAAGIMDIIGAAEGSPTKKYYEQAADRCWTPFLFALVDPEGDVYPCCYLYRDNHNTNARTKWYREQHRMGNVRGSFREAWVGEAYRKLRADLERVDPGNPAFAPCAECTRHCHHNAAITKLFRIYSDDPAAFVATATSEQFSGHNGPVWF